MQLTESPLVNRWIEEWHKTAATIASIEAFLAYLRRGE